MSDERPLPGSVGVFNENCPWGTRVGFTAIVAHTKGAEGVYPVHGLADNEVIVFVVNDPVSPARGLRNGWPWSCVAPVDSLDIVFMPGASLQIVPESSEVITKDEG